MLESNIREVNREGLREFGKHSVDLLVDEAIQTVKNNDEDAISDLVAYGNELTMSLTADEAQKLFGTDLFDYVDISISISVRENLFAQGYKNG